MKQVEKLYFAYGSNMSLERIQSRVGNVKTLGVYKLKGYRLVFDAGFKDEVFANMIKTGNIKDYVEGVVYSLTPRQLKILDQAEGAPYLYTRMLEAFGKENLHVYICINEVYKNIGIPKNSYLGHIIVGCTQNNIKSTMKVIAPYLKKVA